MDKQFNLTDLLKLYLRHWWRIVVVMLICGILSGAYTLFFINPTYESAGSLYAENTSDTVSGTTNVNLNEIMVRQELVRTYAEVLSSNVFLKKVAKESNLDYTYQDILNMVTMRDKNETEILVISVESEDPSHAFIIAQTMINLASSQIAEIVEGGNVKVLDEPEYPEGPSSPNLVKNIAVGLLGGLILCMAIIYVLELLDNKVKDSEMLSKTFKYPVLGEVPYISATVNSKKNVNNGAFPKRV